MTKSTISPISIGVDIGKEVFHMVDVRVDAENHRPHWAKLSRIAIFRDCAC